MKNNTFNSTVLPLLSCLAATLSIVLFSISSAIPAEQIGINLITADPKVRYNVSNQDDLSLIRRYFQGASWEMPIPPETWHLLQPLGISKAA